MQQPNMNSEDVRWLYARYPSRRWRSRKSNPSSHGLQTAGRNDCNRWHKPTSTDRFVTVARVRFLLSA